MISSATNVKVIEVSLKGFLDDEDACIMFPENAYVLILRV